MITSNIYTRIDSDVNTVAIGNITSLYKAGNITLKALIVWIIFQLMLYAFLGFGNIIRGGIVIQQCIWSVLTSLVTIAFIVYMQFQYSGIPFKSSLASKQMKRVTFVSFIWSFGRLVHTVLYVIRESELDNPDDFNEISDNTGPLIITLVDLIITEFFCYYLVLNYMFFKIFLPEDTVSASIALMPRPKNDSFSMEMQDSSTEISGLIINREIFSQRGKLGILYQGQLNNEAVIVRRITLGRMSNYVIEKLQQDITEINNIANPYLLNNIKLLIKKPTIDLVMPLISGGSLFSALHEKKIQFTIQEKLQIGKEIALSLKLIHSQNRTHGHLSSHNVLLDSKSIYITDIGLEHLKKYAGLVGAYCNKNAWSSPEVLKESGAVVIKPTIYDDAYSFGIILWEIITEQEPFPNYTLKKLKSLVGDESYRPALSECGMKGIEELIKSCWNIEPTHRPSFQLIFSTLSKLYDNSL